MACGIIIVDKPSDWTSQDVTAKLRGVFHEKRIGHGGTLDPMATGVLTVFVGRATRAVEFAQNAHKEYIAGLRLGITTNTQDTSGEVTDRREVNITKEQLQAVLAQFTGEIDQIPPMYSAVKIGGQKLYELARKGREVERAARRIVIEELSILEGDGEDWLLRVRCSKGTYVRTLCHDIGAALGCGGCMSSLRRTAAGDFTLAEATPLADIIAHDEPQSLLRPVDSLFAGFPALTVDAAQTAKLKCGQQLRFAHLANTYRVYSAGGEFLALAKHDGKVLTVLKSFYEVN